MIKKSGFLQTCAFLVRNLKRHRSFATAATSGKEVTVDLMEDSCQGVAVINMNRPERKNALSVNFSSELYNVIEGIKYDSSIRVVILRSLVKNIFCAGADLKERPTLSNMQVHAFVNTLRHLANTIEDLPVPVIAALDGFAVGGGLEIALACDLRVAASNAKMGLVETSLAIIPGAGGTQRLPRLIGVPKAKELIYTSRLLNGQNAFDIGLVNNVVEQNPNGDAAYLASLELAKEILPNGPIGVQMAKKAINKGSQVDIHTGCFIEEACYSKVITTNDRMEGLQAFKEKRKPMYLGE